MSISTSISNLKECGFSFIKPFFSTAVRRDVLDFAKRRVIISDSNSAALVIEKQEIYLPEECNFSSVRNLSKHLNKRVASKTVIYRRVDCDDGLFIDLINPDFQISDLRKEFIESSVYSALLKEELIPDNEIEFHVYYTRSCLNPRSWHIDGQSLKIFTYLTDVDEEHGPYAYQLQSQNYYEQACQYNQSRKFPVGLKEIKSMTVDQYLNTEKVVTPTGNQGITFMSNQSGIHRGMRQEKNKERFVLVAQLPLNPIAPL